MVGWQKSYKNPSRLIYTDRSRTFGGTSQRTKTASALVAVTSSNMRSPIASWTLYDATKPQERTLSSQATPYSSVLEAVAHGYRIVKFPISKLYQFSDLRDDCLGDEFISEKWT